MSSRAEHCAILSLDGRLYATLEALLLKPGLLGKEYLVRQLRAPALHFSAFGGESVLFAGIFVVMPSHIALRLRSMDGGRLATVIPRGMALCLEMQLLLVACHHVLFWATLASL